MTVLKVLAVILLVLYLLGLIRVGGGAEYSADGFRAWVRAGAFHIQVFPRGKKKERKKKAKKVKKKEEPKGEQAQMPQKPEEPKEENGGALELVKDVLPVVCEAAGELKRRIRIDNIFLNLTTGGEDPAMTAMTYGYSSAVLGGILALIDQSFDLKDYRVHTGMDFNGTSNVIYINAALSARIGQLVSFGIRFGLKGFKIYRKHKNNLKKEAS